MKKIQEWIHWNIREYYLRWTGLYIAIPEVNLRQIFVKLQQNTVASEQTMCCYLYFMISFDWNLKESEWIFQLFSTTSLIFLSIFMLYDLSWEPFFGEIKKKYAIKLIIGNVVSAYFKSQISDEEQVISNHSDNILIAIYWQLRAGKIPDLY